MLIIELEKNEYESLKVDLVDLEVDFETVRSDGIEADSIMQLVLAASSVISAGTIKIILELIRAKANATIKIAGMEFKGYSKEDIIKIVNEFEAARREQ